MTTRTHLHPLAWSTFRCLIILQILQLLACFSLWGGTGPAWALADLDRIPQDPRLLVQADEAEKRLLSPEAQAERADDYLRRHFDPWRRAEALHSAREAFWALDRYEKRPAWGENLQLRDPSWLEDLAALCDRGNYPSRAERAIAVDNLALRGLPSDHPHFNDPALAGEGYPFDNLQNSAVWAGTPLLVTHASSDGSWLHVEAPFAAGWVHPSQIAYVDEAFVRAFMAGPFAVVAVDDLAVKDREGLHRFRAQTGTLLPLVRADAWRLTVRVPFGDGRGEAHLAEAVIERGKALPFPHPLTPWKVATLAARLAGQSYGWGGLYGNRDCSALTRDLFTPFGLWLPRNSGGQRQTGHVVGLEGLSPEEKTAVIVARGRPFASLVGMAGHVMVYVGQRGGKPLVFHNLWGIRTLDRVGVAGRHVIGRAVVTTLEAGRELPLVAPGGLLIDRVTELILLTDDREKDRGP